MGRQGREQWTAIDEDGTEWKRTEVINGVGRVVRGYLVEFPHPMYFFPSSGLKSVAQHTAIDGKCVEFFFFISFSAVGAGTSLWPWTDGHRRYQRRGKGGKGLYC